MTTITAIVDTQTGEFVEFGHVLDARYVVVPLPRNPNHAQEKYSGNPGDPFVAKTSGEIAANMAAKADAEAGAQYDGNTLLKAKAISDLAWRLGKAPGALTNAEINAERARIINIYKALPQAP